MTPDAVLMIRPYHFGFNSETAASNSFQKNTTFQDVSQRAVEEFDAMVKTLRDHGISVWVHPDQDDAVCPDAVFPNNWLAVMPTGEVILFPMMAQTRRLEVNRNLVKKLCEDYRLGPVIDLTSQVNENQFLEGTGSIVFDHENKLAYACESPRTDLKLLSKICRHWGYEAISFGAVDLSGQPIYHTNVLMSMGDKTAILCSEAIENSIERAMLRERLRNTGKLIIEISYAQMTNFAGNAFFVCSEAGGKWIFSHRAVESLQTTQIDLLQSDGEIVAVHIPTIETLGGGSARCMVAGIFNPNLKQ